MTLKLSTRSFCLAADDALYALGSTRAIAMMRDPAAHPIPRFAGQHVRCAEIIVVLENRKPIRVAAQHFFMWQFDSQGVLDRKELSHDFLVGGGRWRPSRALTALIRNAALGNVRTRRL
jgi:hypothetical protein